MMLTSVPLLSQNTIGFIDNDSNGINDWFCDVNGDGINDIDGKAYRHSFRYQDMDADGINDLYRDEDGDGVNDLSTSSIDLNNDDRNDNVLDTDRDWINDVTGLIYNRRITGGDRYGMVLEDMGYRVENYLDENMDGHFDNSRLIFSPENHPGKDVFIDEDGDGVSDGRGFFRHRPPAHGGNERPGHGPGHGGE